MSKVWPYYLKGDGAIRTVRLPVGAQVLSVYWRGSGPCLSVLVANAKPEERRRFLLAAFGEPVPDGSVYIGTVTGEEAPAPIHVFELVEVA